MQIPNFSLASLDCRSENIGVLSVVIPKLEFSNVQMQIFLANLVISADDTTLQDRPEAFDGVSVNSADDMLADGVVYGLVRKRRFRRL